MLGALLKKVQGGLGLAPSAPLTIDPEAAAILNSSTRMVKEILAKRAEMDRNGQKDTPLFVAMGEHHNRPAHKLHHIAVTKGLIEAGEKIGFAIEQPRDYLAKLFCDHSKIALRADIMNGLDGRDTDGKITLHYLRAHVVQRANYAARLLYDYLLRHDVPTRLTDASRLHVDKKDEGYIDTRDDQSFVSLEQYAADDMSNLCSRLSFTGVKARNHCMAVEAIKFAEQSGTRIVLQQCGIAHAVGKNHFPINDSLAGQFNKNGMPAMSLLLDGAYYNNTLDEEILRTIGYHALIDSNLPLKEFELLKGHKTSAEEIEYTRALMTEMGWQKEFGSADDLEARRTKSAQAFKAAENEWKKEFSIGVVGQISRFTEKLGL